MEVCRFTKQIAVFGTNLFADEMGSVESESREGKNPSENETERSESFPKIKISRVGMTKYGNHSRDSRKTKTQYSTFL